MLTTRRGFLGVLSAFAAAAASGVRLPSSACKTPIRAVQADLLAMLADCRAISVERCEEIGGLHKAVIQFLHAPDAPRTSLDDMADVARKNLRPISVSLTVECDDIVDLALLGDMREYDPAGRRQIAEVVFA